MLIAWFKNGIVLEPSQTNFWQVYRINRNVYIFDVCVASMQNTSVTLVYSLIPAAPRTAGSCRTRVS